MGTKREEWAAQVRRWRRSGKTAREFAASAGLNASTLGYWAWRLEHEGKTSVAPRGRRRRAKPAAAASFVEMLVPAAVKGPAEPFELEISGARRLRIPAAFEPSALERLLAVLEGRR
jgi:transposase